MPQVRRRAHIRTSRLMCPKFQRLWIPTTTEVTTSEDSEENYESEQFYDCWFAVAQPAHAMPTQKKPKKKAKQVRFTADVPHANETREE
eukprot:2483480-Amphidinium_carterae.1